MDRTILERLRKVEVERRVVLRSLRSSCEEAVPTTR